MRRRLRGKRGESMLGCRGPKGGGEIGRREEGHPLTRQRGGERRGGHPLKQQRGIGKGETCQRAKEDARRTRPSKEGESMWEIDHLKEDFL